VYNPQHEQGIGILKKYNTNLRLSTKDNKFIITSDNKILLSKEDNEKLLKLKWIIEENNKIFYYEF